MCTWWAAVSPRSHWAIARAGSSTSTSPGSSPAWVSAGEYAAINSAIDELIPARFRGRVDIAINGTYWGGAILGTLGTFIFLKAIDLSLGWRLAFLIGPVLGLGDLLVCGNLPESPRWEVMNGRVEAAERSDFHIEHEVESTGKTLPAVDESKAIELQPTETIGDLR